MNWTKLVSGEKERELHRKGNSKSEEHGALGE